MFKTISTFVVAVIIIAFCGTFIWAQEESHEFVVLYTGDAHGALYPCECPLEPDGGVARRATLVNKLRDQYPGKTLLIDGGGFITGGPYDEYIAGSALDKVRSKAMISAMAAMKYDAVVVGDDEFNYGLDSLTAWTAQTRLPLVSANLTLKKTGANFCPPYIIKEIAGTKVAIIGLTTTEQSLIQDDGARGLITVKTPLESAAATVAEVRARGASFVILVAHLGLDASREIAEKVPNVDLILNAHRRVTRNDELRVKNTVIAQFHLQGRKLAVINVKTGKDQKIAVSAVRLSDQISDDPNMKKLLAAYEKDRSAVETQNVAYVTAELFKMGHCPYSAEPEKELIKLQKQLGAKLRVKLRFIVNVNSKGEVESLHGQNEIEEDLRQLCLQKYFPEKVMPYLEWRHARGYIDEKTEDDLPWEKILDMRRKKIEDKLKEMDISLGRLNGCMKSDEGDQLLRDDAFLCERLDINSSPTLLFNNRMHQHQLGYADLRLLKSACDAGGKEFHPECQRVPQCFFDFDCLKRGFEVKCLNAGKPQAKCEFVKAVPVPMIALVDFNSVSYRLFFKPQEAVETTLKFVPGAQPRFVDYLSEEGKELIGQNKITMLPAYVLNKDAKQSLRWKDIKNAYEMKDESYLSIPAMTLASQDISRERRPGQVDFFLTALDAESVGVLLACEEGLKSMAKPPAFAIHFLAYLNEKGEISAKNGLPEIEESLRQMALRKLAPEKYLPYLQLRVKALNSSYWQDPLIALKIDPEEIRKLAATKEIQQELLQDIKLREGLGVYSEFILLLNNQEVIVARSLPRQVLFDNLDDILKSTLKK